MTPELEAGARALYEAQRHEHGYAKLSDLRPDVEREMVDIWTKAFAAGLAAYDKARAGET